MKRLTILFLSVFFILSISAKEYICLQDTITETIAEAEQTGSSENSSVIYNGSSYNVIFSWKKNKKHLSPHWTGIGMGFMDYNSDKIPNGSLKMSTSHNFTVNLFDSHKQLSNHWLLVSGIGTEWSRYHFDENAALTKQDGKTLFEPAPEGINYKSTKLLAYYVTVPLLFEYQASNFHISGGAVAMFKYYSKSQIKYYIENKKYVENKGRDLNIRPIDLRLRIQIGFDDIAIYGYYAPISMFKKDKGPELRTYTIGLMIGV